ncbi:MAG TPA: hypothetical protein VJT67_16675 [Longimicrobiaceae bacterium]|nr:hypothetical protein [Longimicrobiaceae bacterium]
MPTPEAGEPTRTIFGEEWRAAKNRVRRLRQNDRALLVPLLDVVESAWPRVRTLQVLHDQLRPYATGLFAHLLDFIDTHVCDLFRSVAVDVARFVPPPPGARAAAEPDFDSANADAAQFGVFVAVLHAACCDPTVPASAAEVIRGATQPLLPWYEAVEPLLRRAADAVQGVPE